MGGREDEEWMCQQDKRAADSLQSTICAKIDDDDENNTAKSTMTTTSIVAAPWSCNWHNDVMATITNESSPLQTTNWAGDHNFGEGDGSHLVNASMVEMYSCSCNAPEHPLVFFP